MIRVNMFAMPTGNQVLWRTGNRITPSWVAFNDEERLVGDAAKNQYASNPQRTIFDIKRFIGRKWSDKDVQADVKHVPFKVEGKDGKKHEPAVTFFEQYLILSRKACSYSRRKVKSLLVPLNTLTSFF